MGKRYQL